MEEILFKWTDRFGFPVVISFILIYALYRVLNAYREVTDKAKEEVKAHADRVHAMGLDSNKATNNLANEIKNNTAETRQATGAQLALAARMEKFGSDPAKWCKAIEDQKCKADQVVEFLKNRDRLKNEGNRSGEKT
jgi:uncharacterized coiled-coil DUF342 family protein